MNSAWDLPIEIPVTYKQMRVLAECALALAEKTVPLMESVWDRYSLVQEAAADAVTFDLSNVDQQHDVERFGGKTSNGVAYINRKAAQALLQQLMSYPGILQDDSMRDLAMVVARSLGVKTPKIPDSEPSSPSDTTPVEYPASNVPGADKAKYAEIEKMSGMMNNDEHRGAEYHQKPWLDPIELPQGSRMTKSEYSNTYIPDETRAQRVAQQDRAGSAGAQSASNTDWSPDQVTSGRQDNFLKPASSEAGESFTLDDLGVGDDDWDNIEKKSSSSRTWDSPDQLAQQQSNIYGSKLSDQQRSDLQSAESDDENPESWADQWGLRESLMELKRALHGGFGNV